MSRPRHSVRSTRLRYRYADGTARFRASWTQMQHGMTFFAPWMEALRFTADVQQVMGMRIAKFARGEAHGAREAQQMISEKLEAFGEAQFAAAAALAAGGSFETAMKRAFVPYRRRVRANRRRLQR